MADELRQLRQLRDEYDDRIQRLKWSIAQEAAAAANGGAKGPEAEEVRALVCMCVRACVRACVCVCVYICVVCVC